MAEALIGHTGFVGGNLRAQHPFTDLFNSTTIPHIRGRSFARVVCAGAPAEKWRANQDPARDLATIEGLIDHLRSVETAEFVLISTVDVYPAPIGVDEDSPIDSARASAYGRHRRLLEQFCQDRFDARVIRLPALFGAGLKKNVIYDLLHDNRLEAIHADASFQYYNLAHLWSDVQTAAGLGLRLVNFATEPVTVEQVARTAFGRTFENRPTPSAGAYDLRSKHAAAFGGAGGYLYSGAQVLAELAAFVQTDRARRAAP